MRAVGSEGEGAVGRMKEQKRQLRALGGGLGVEH